MEEFINKWKNYPAYIRVIVCVLVSIGLIYVYYYTPEVEQTDQELSSLESTLATKNMALAQAEKKKRELPNLKKELDNIQDQLAQVRRALPVDLVVDDVLRNVQLAANKTFVDLIRFEPSAAIVEDSSSNNNNSANNQNNNNQNNNNNKKKDEEKKYDVMLIKISALGSFNAVMQFLDELVHFDNQTEIEDLKFSTLSNPKTTSSSAQKDESTEQRIRRLKESSRVAVGFKLKAYKAKI